MIFLRCKNHPYKKIKKLKKYVKDNLNLYDYFTVSSVKSEDVYHMGFRGNVYKPIGVESKYDYVKYSNNATYIASKWCKPEIEKLACELNNDLKRQMINLIREYLINNYYKECIRYQNVRNIYLLKYSIDQLIEEKEKNRKYQEEARKIGRIKIQLEIENINLLNGLRNTYLNLLKKNIINKEYIIMYERNMINCGTQKEIESLYNSLIDKSKKEEIKIDDFKKKEKFV